MMYQLSQHALAIWAKTGGRYKLEEHLWEPLFVHMADSAEITRLLWREWLPAATKMHISTCAGLSVDEMELIVCWLAGVHDIGKATPAFQSKVKHRADYVRERGLAVPDRIVKGRPHASVGQVLLQNWLVNRGWNSRNAMTYTSIVGGHHGSTPNTSEIDDIASLARIDPDECIGNNAWTSVQEELLTFVFEHCNLSSIEATLQRSQLAPSGQVLLSGLVIVADWIASNSDMFPLTCSQSTTWRDCQQRAALAWHDLSFPAPMRHTRHAHDHSAFFHQRFPKLPKSAVLRPTQEDAIQAANEMQDPGLIIIEAPMGSGKTEAALLCAEILVNKFGEGGLAYLLPTMATSNAMFGRVHTWLDVLCKSANAEAQSLQLLHSKAELNEEYAQLKTWNSSWMGDERSGNDSVIAHQWFNGRKRGLLASFVVGTVDQMLMSALNARHVHLRHLGLAGKVVIVDEVHAYDAYMNAFLERSLQFLGQHGVPTILLSATLPENRREALIKAYRSQNSHTVLQDAPRTSADKPPYPLISVAPKNKESGPIYISSETSSPDVKIELEYIPDDEELLVKKLSSLISDGGCACVIRNTVSRAQNTYISLKESLNSEILLAHSRFIGADRIKNDDCLLELLGPDSENRPRSLIVVGTQVLEQSLDIDFDVMVTDIAPMDLLLQRMGRLHRHIRGIGQSRRPTRLQQARCIITGVDDWDTDLPRFASGIDRIYHPAVLWQTIQVLRDYKTSRGQGLRLPGDIASLIESTYESLLQTKSNEQQARSEQFEMAVGKWREETKEKKGTASIWLLKKLKERGGINDWMRDCLKHGEETRGRSAVRDSEESLEVVVVTRSDKGISLLPRIAATYHVPESLGDDDSVPDASSARIAAMCTVALPMVLSQPWRIDSVIASLEKETPLGWQQSHWLKGMLPLVLDSKGEASINCDNNTFVLRYTEEKGLEMLKRKEDPDE